MTDSVKDNTEKQRFELAVDGQTVFADYRLDGSTLYIRHVEAPSVLRGTGAAGRLMQGMMDIAREKGWKVVPVCSYAGLWIQRHPDYHDLRA